MVCIKNSNSEDKMYPQNSTQETNNIYTHGSEKADNLLNILNFNLI